MWWRRKKPKLQDEQKSYEPKEYDPMTGQMVSAGWVAKRSAMFQETLSKWDENDGTCLLCNQPMRLHPPARLYAADPSLCPRGFPDAAA